MRLYLLFIIAIFCSHFALANNSVDSLKNIFNSNTEDSVKLRILLEISDNTYLHNPDSDIVICNQIIELAAIKVNQLTANSPEFKVYAQYLIRGYEGLGYNLENQADIDSALSYYEKSLKIAQQLNDSLLISNSLNQIAGIHGEQEDFETALDFYNQSLTIRTKINDYMGKNQCYNNIGYMYRCLENYTKAKLFYKKSLEMSRILKNEKLEATTLHNIGIIYERENDLDNALKFYLESLAIEEKLNNKAGIAASKYNIGFVYLDKGNVIKAKEYALDEMKIAKELGYPDEISAAANLLSNIYKAEKNWKLALEMYELDVFMMDSINNSSNQKAALRQQAKYEFEKQQLIVQQQKKEAERQMKEELTRRNNLQYSFIFLGILVFFGLTLGLGFIKVSPTVAEGLIFFVFLILFEFLLVLSDPFIDSLTGGEPIYKLLANAFLAGAIFPAHAFFEKTLKKRLVKS